MKRLKIDCQVGLLRIRTLMATMLVSTFATTASTADVKADTPEKFTYQVTGLFQPDRENDLREVFAETVGIRLVSLDYKTAEAVVEFDPKKLFPGAKPADILKRFDEMLRTATQGTFGVKPPRSTPAEKLQWIEIVIEGLDCKACSLGAYDAVFKLEGVEQATASFKEGRVRAWINPEVTSREKLEAALKQRRVPVKSQ